MSETLDLSRLRVCVVMNRGSGRGKEKRLRGQIEDALKPRCAHFEIRPTTRGSDLLAAAIRELFWASRPLNLQ